MWLGSFRVLYVTTALVTGFGLLGHDAFAQQNQGQDTQTTSQQQGQTTQSGQNSNATQNNANTNNNVPPAPPSNQLTAQQIVTAPRLEPMLTQQEMAARAAAQQQAAQQAAQQGGYPQQQQLVPMQGYDLQAQQQIAQQQMMQMQAQLQQQQQMMAAQQQAAQQQAAQTPAQTETPAQPAAAAETPSATPTTTTGFAPEAASAQIPVTGGMLPTESVITNQGMDMSINPDLVGGYDPNQPASETNPVPYEIQLEQRTQELQQKARAIAFEQAKKSALPMETYEIRDVLSRLKDTQEAIQTPVRPAPRPSNVIKTVSTDPSARPQTIHLAAGNVSTLNFVDITGEPWPIVDIGFGGAFDVKPPEAGGHVIRITPLRDFARGNLVVRLLKMTTPLTFSLKSGGENVYYRFDARIPDYGPNAKMPLISEGIKTFAGDKVTTSFLEGVPPTGSTKLNVEGVDARTTAFRFSGTMYVRTPLSLLSPAWQGSATSADGMNVYVLQETPVLLLSDKGSLVRAHISDQKRVSSGF